MVIPVDGRLSTHIRLWRFLGPLTGVLCKLLFAEFVEKCKVRWKRPLPDSCRRFLEKLQPNGRTSKR